MVTLHPPSRACLAAGACVVATALTVFPSISVLLPGHILAVWVRGGAGGRVGEVEGSGGWR